MSETGVSQSGPPEARRELPLNPFLLLLAFSGGIAIAALVSSRPENFQNIWPIFAVALGSFILALGLAHAGFARYRARQTALLREETAQLLKQAERIQARIRRSGNPQSA